MPRFPHCLPALIRTQKVQKKMERYYDVFQNDADSYQEAREALDGLQKKRKTPERPENWPDSSFCISAICFG